MCQRCVVVYTIAIGWQYIRHYASHLNMLSCVAREWKVFFFYIVVGALLKPYK